ncbi:zinc-ribbon domain-containing protein [Haematobacter genomosp. 1]|uniref:zinc-ribbon domain-containing protein n=1 Tax=Haematobacter genomosp. 1 TaxID=366618 RepID=UPI001C529CC9|nr:zinc-ribbon domain-containing protein [Haematobacter genomosp. 1]
MRLICANCGAQYEISDTAIPPQGREVQCAACGHSWFQTREDATSATPAPLPRRPVDEGVLNVLREEAAREAEARRSANHQSEAETPAPQATLQPPKPAPAAPPSAPAIGEAQDAGRPQDVDRPQDVSQPQDVGQSQGMDRPQERGQPQDTAPREAAVPSPAKSAQPVASPARPRNWEPAPGPVDMPVNQALEDFVNEEESERGRRRFHIGFACGLLLVACLVALYIVGPGLAEDMPGLAPYITTYVENVNAARSWLRDLAAPLISALQD